MVLCEGAGIQPQHLPAAIAQSSRAAAAADNAPLPTLEQLERTHIRQALQSSDGHRGKAAKIPGISERNLYRKLREHGLLS